MTLDKAIQRTEEMTPEESWFVEPSGRWHSIRSEKEGEIATCDFNYGNEADFIASAPDLCRLMLDVVKAADELSAHCDSCFCTDGANWKCVYCKTRQALTAFGERVGGGE
jgi:hypothetical protein